MEDEGRPFGVALRGEASNRPLLHWLKTVVVSDVGKGALDVSGGDQEDDGCRSVETYKDDIETGVARLLYLTMTRVLSWLALLCRRRSTLSQRR